MEQPVLAHACDQNVGKSIVVIIADSNTHAVHFHIKSGAGGNIGEAAVSVVVIKPERRATLLVAGPIHSVDQKNVLPAIAVIVEKSTTGTQSLGQKLSSKRPAVVLKLNTG